MKTIFCASLATFTVKPCQIASETDIHYFPVTGLRFLKKSPVSSYFNTQVEAYDFLLANRKKLLKTRQEQVEDIEVDIYRLETLRRKIPTIKLNSNQ